MINFILRLANRGVKYTSVGVTTFVIDMIIVATLLTWFNLPYQGAIGLGFLIGVTLNYFLSYFYVYAGTEQTIVQGYVIFFLLAVGGMVFITLGVTYLVEIFEIGILVARLLTGTIVGLSNFIINTFLNFKVV